MMLEASPECTDHRELVGIASLQARTEGIRRHDSSGAVAWVALPDSIGPEDGIRRLRRGIRGPKVAAAFQAGPELIGLPGFSGTRIREVHHRSATLAAHLKIDVTHSPDSSTEPSWCPAGHVPPGMRCLQEPGSPRSMVHPPWLLSFPRAFVLTPRTSAFVLPGLNLAVIGGLGQRRNYRRRWRRHLGWPTGRGKTAARLRSV